jgi:aldehyde dehydrogenase (NAD+)
MTENERIFKLQRELSRSNPTIDIKERRNALLKLKQVIKDKQIEIEQALFSDLHKSKEESYLTEIGIVLSEINFALKHLTKWSKKRKVRSSLSLFPSKAYILPQAYGVVYIIAPWNYPFQLSLCPLIGAIAAGNRVLLSPSSQSPHTTLVLQKLINNNFSEELIHCFEGNRINNKEILSLKPDYLFFTGSPQSAKEIMKQTCEDLIPATLELGGKSPVIIDQDANLEIAAKRTAFGKFINCGQTCIAPDHLFIHSSVKQRFIKLFLDFVKSEFENNAAESKYYGRIINNKHFQRLIGLLENQNIIHGGQFSQDDNYISPTLIDEPDMESNIMQEEIFGPILPIVSFDNINQVLTHIQSKERPLALYYFGSKNKDIVNKTVSGGCCINDTIMHIVPHALPFGGIGHSGMGAYHGKASFDTFTHYKSILYSHKHIDMKLKYPPYTKTARKLFKILFEKI